jgi:uncharacterized protein
MNLADWYNPYLFVPFAAWLVAQSVKFIRGALKGDPSLRYFFVSGDMPSAHSAAVCALAVTALILNGFSSAIFGLSGFFAAVVIYDSFGVRRASGDQAVVINTILRNIDGKAKGKLSKVKVREVLGHKPSEVVVGALLGTVVALLLNASQL